MMILKNITAGCALLVTLASVAIRKYIKRELDNAQHETAANTR